MKPKVVLGEVVGLTDSPDGKPGRRHRRTSWCARPSGMFDQSPGCRRTQGSRCSPGSARAPPRRARGSPLPIAPQMPAPMTNPGGGGRSPRRYPPSARWSRRAREAAGCAAFTAASAPQVAELEGKKAASARQIDVGEGAQEQLFPRGVDGGDRAHRAARRTPGRRAPSADRRPFPSLPGTRRSRLLHTGSVCSIPGTTRSAFRGCALGHGTGRSPPFRPEFTIRFSFRGHFFASIDPKDEDGPWMARQRSGRHPDDD